MKLSIVIPVYNEADTVAALVDQVRALPLDKELLIIDDGSTDGTAAALARFAGLPDVRIHHNPVNLGKGASVRIGFAQATGDIVTIQDADFELDPTEFERLVRPIVDGEADVVFGSRFLAGGRRGSWAFYLANRGLTAVGNLLFGASLTDLETCYKLIRRDVLATLTLRASRFELEPELMAQLCKRGSRIVELPIDYRPRTRADGKKLSWRDGFAALVTLVDQRLKE
jgi:glycosyltransferase involved in cell wall biosynthesis